jgi:hypothetical protein
VSGEQAVVVEHRKELTYLLGQAAQIEPVYARWTR